MSPDNLKPDQLPPLLPAAEPPLVAGPPPPAAPARPASPVRRVLAVVLSLCLGLFLADGVVSLADDSLILLLDLHLLMAVRAMVFGIALLVALVVYGLMGLTPWIPKRWFLPLTLFGPAASLAVVPLMIFFHDRMQQISLGVSAVQVVFGLGLLFWIQGDCRLRWLPVTEDRLGARGFSWVNLLAFVLMNAFVLLPAVMVYLAGCVVVAVDHFSAGFVALQRDGVTLRVRDYVRSDGKAIQLIPMAHIGEARFYRELSDSFPTNAIVLMEGVTDEGNLLTNKINYQRMAKSLGLSEQADEFQPERRAEVVHADVDVGVFSTNTIGIINLVMLLHTKGVTLETVLPLLSYAPPPEVEQELWDDLLGKRNRHLLEQIEIWLPEAETLIVPWGAAHMPEIAREIEELGFQVDRTREFRIVRFGSRARKPAGRQPGAGDG